jgi:hypothetical protein
MKVNNKKKSEITSSILAGGFISTSGGDVSCSGYVDKKTWRQTKYDKFKYILEEIDFIGILYFTIWLSLSLVMLVWAYGHKNC